MLFFQGSWSGLLERLWCVAPFFWCSPMKEQLEQFVKRVKERHEDCRGNEQATKQSLIAPLFTILGYDMADPKECKPEYKVDFGKYRIPTKPIDWAFAINSTFVFCGGKEGSRSEKA